jgi:hypothetical protein
MKTRLALSILLALSGPVAAHAAVTAASGYAVHSVPVAGPLVCGSPASVQGGVARRGGATFVGWGQFGVGCETVLRIDEDGVTTIADGFNSLGGFDLDRTGRLLVCDNGGDQIGAVTGDTLFAVPDPIARATSLPALGAELVPTGSIPSCQDVAALHDGSALVGDAQGVGIGRVVRVNKGAVKELITDLDYVAGLAVDSKKTIFVGNVDGTFAGSVTRYKPTGKPIAPLATGLAGEYAHAFDADGILLATAGSDLVAIDRNGGVTPRAQGFGFSGDVSFDAARDEALVLDFGATAITTICRDRDNDGVCDVDDDCPTTSDVSQTDTDDDGLGDACPCTGAALAKAHLTIGKLATPGGDDTLSFNAVLTGVGSIDPVTNGVRFLVRGATDDTVINATVPGGAYDADTKTGWKPTKNGFQYKNALGGVLGITKVDLKIAGATVKVGVKGANGNWRVQVGDLPLTATVVLGAGADCGASAFAGCTIDGKKATCK